ncbi:MAG: metal-dependent hydrolase [archaeon]
MQYHTHAAGGLVFGMLSVKYALASFAGPSFLLFVVLGSLLPDIDHPKSKVGRWVPILPRLMKHRGLSHSLFGLGVSAAVLILLFNFAGFTAWHISVAAMSVGFFSHLALDSLNPKGVHWFRPLHKVHFKGPIETGTIFESAILVLLIFALGFLLRDFGLAIFHII